MRMHSITLIAASVILLGGGTAAAQVQSHTLFEFPTGAEFIPNPFVIDDDGIGSGGVEITDFPVDGEIVDTRLELTLNNVPPDFAGLSLDAAHVYVRVTLNGQSPGLPFSFQRSVVADGFTAAADGFVSVSLGFAGTGGPMTAATSASGLNGDVIANFWRIDWGSREWPDDPVNYGPVSGRIIVDYVPACLCERTGDDPASVDVFDLLAYLDQWFALDDGADVDGAAGVDVFDLLTFLDCWFAPC